MRRLVLIMRCGNLYIHFPLFRVAASSIPFPILNVLLTSFDCHVICNYGYLGWANEWSALRSLIVITFDEEPCHDSGEIT